MKKRKGIVILAICIMLIGLFLTGCGGETPEAPTPTPPKLSPIEGGNATTPPATDGASASPDASPSASGEDPDASPSPSDGGDAGESPDPADGSQTGKIKADDVNVRDKPSTEDSEVLTSLDKDATVTILGTEGDWYKIKTGDTTGYVRNDFITVSE